MEKFQFLLHSTMNIETFNSILLSPTKVISVLYFLTFYSYFIWIFFCFQSRFCHLSSVFLLFKMICFSSFFFYLLLHGGHLLRPDLGKSVQAVYSQSLIRLLKKLPQTCCDKITWNQQILKLIPLYLFFLVSFPAFTTSFQLVLFFNSPVCILSIIS